MTTCTFHAEELIRIKPQVSLQLRCMSSRTFICLNLISVCHRKELQSGNSIQCQQSRSFYTCNMTAYTYVLTEVRCIVSKLYIEVNSSILNFKSVCKILKFRTYIWPKRKPTIYLVASQRNQCLQVRSKHKLKVQ